MKKGAACTKDFYEKRNCELRKKKRFFGGKGAACSKKKNFWGKKALHAPKKTIFGKKGGKKFQAKRSVPIRAENMAGRVQ